MERYDSQKWFPEARPDDLCLTFRDFEPGELPLEQAVIKTETGFEELEGSMAELGTGLLLAVQSSRCSDPELVFRALEQRRGEVENYRKRACCFRRNGDCNSNFFTVTAAGNGTVWVRNEGKHSLRFQTADGLIYRVCAGYTQALSPSNRLARLEPIQILLELEDNPLDVRVGAVRVRYGRAPWQWGGLDCLTGSQVDSSFCRVFCGDDCLGVLESYSDYFLERPKLKFLDIDSYGPSQWFVRNKGQTTLPLVWPDGRQAGVPADGQVYRLNALAEYAYTEEADT